MSKPARARKAAGQTARRRGAASPDIAATFAALGDSVRLDLVSRLCAQGPQSIAGLAAGATVSRQAVTKHLRVLERAGLIVGTRQGRESRWQLRTERLAEAQAQLDRIAQHWDAALLRLQALVEDDG